MTGKHSQRKTLLHFFILKNTEKQKYNVHEQSSAKEVLFERLHHRLKEDSIIDRSEGRGRGKLTSLFPWNVVLAEPHT